MRSLISCCVVAAFLVLLTTAPPASADTLTLNVTLSSNTSFYSYGTGGEFKVTVNPWSSPLPIPAMGAGVQVGGSGFQTFCLERSEFFDPGTAYYASIEPWAILGGLSGQDVSATQDSVDPMTAYLYTKFWDGTLAGSGYDYTVAGRSASAGALQEAIWWIEGELPSSLLTDLSTQAQAWVNEAGLAVAGSWGKTIGQVRALNLWSTKGILDPHENPDNKDFKIQSHLVMVPVPLPATTYASFAMLGLISILRLRRNRSQA